MNNATSPENHLHESVRQLILSAQEGAKWEKRRHTRFPYARAVTIDFWDSARQIPALTREISQIGVGLLHKSPLPTYKTINMTMRYNRGFALTIPMACAWCRPCGKQWYISGCCFKDSITNDEPAVDGYSRHSEGKRTNNFISWDPENTLVPKLVLHVLKRKLEGLSELSDYDPNVDRRCEERYQASLPVTATPIGENLRPIGQSFDAVTRDISSHGVALFGPKELDHKYLSLQIMDLDGNVKLEAIMKVLRCQTVGDLNTIIGGKFVSNRYFDQRQSKL